MSVRAKLRIANILMSIGMLPLALSVVWVAAAILTRLPGHGASIPIMDPISMLGLLMVSLVFALALAGTSAVWSFWLVRRHPDSRSTTALAFRVLTVAVLASPFGLSML